MKLEGGCYCGAVRYATEGDPAMKAQCHCRECQYITGGGPNYLVAMPAAGFRYVSGSPASFTRDDLDHPVTREFCGRCGTHLVTRAEGQSIVAVKVGTLDDPALYGGPDMAIFAVDRQGFHRIPDGLPTFERLPAAF